MAIVPFDEVDYLSEARSRVTDYLTNKVVFDRYIQLLIEQQTQLQDVFKDLLQKRSIDEAAGANLDIIGEIVGQPRELISADIYGFFGFRNVPSAGTFGDIFNDVVGSLFFDINGVAKGNVVLDDETYRLFIKAKILKNTTSSTPEEFIYFMNFLFGTTLTYVKEGNAGKSARFLVMIGKELSTFEQSLVNYVSTQQGYPSRLLPKTIGVQVDYGYFNADNYFAFQGVPSAKGFGDSEGTGGGIFATLI